MLIPDAGKRAEHGRVDEAERGGIGADARRRGSAPRRMRTRGPWPARASHSGRPDPSRGRCRRAGSPADAMRARGDRVRYRAERYGERAPADRATRPHTGARRATVRASAGERARARAARSAASTKRITSCSVSGRAVRRRGTCSRLPRAAVCRRLSVRSSGGAGALLCAPSASFSQSELTRSQRLEPPQRRIDGAAREPRDFHDVEAEPMSPARGPGR